MLKFSANAVSVFLRYVYKIDGHRTRMFFILYFFSWLIVTKNPLRVRLTGEVKVIFVGIVFKQTENVKDISST